MNPSTFTTIQGEITDVNDKMNTHGIGSEAVEVPAWERTPQQQKTVEQERKRRAEAIVYARNRVLFEPAFAAFQVSRSEIDKNDLLILVQDYVKPSVKYEYYQVFRPGRGGQMAVDFYINDRVNYVLSTIGDMLVADKFASFAALLAYLGAVERTNGLKAYERLRQIKNGARTAEYSNSVVPEQIKLRIDEYGNEYEIEEPEIAPVDCWRWSPEANRHLSHLSPRDQDLVLLLKLHRFEFARVAKLLGWEPDSVRRECSRIEKRLTSLD